MRSLQLTLSLLIWLLSSGGNLWAAAIPFQEYEKYPILGTICAQLKKQVNQHAYKILHVDSKNSYYFNVEETRLFVDNIVTYSRYPVNPVNDINNLRKYLRFLSHSLYIGKQEKDFEFELIRTYPENLYESIYNMTDVDIKEKDSTPDNFKYATSSISIYICNLKDIRVANNSPMKDNQATLALYLDHDNRLIGYDFLGSEELQRKLSDKSKLQNNRIKKDWSLTGWRNYIYFPIDLGICAKQTAGELLKIPFHLVGVPVVKLALLRLAGKLDQVSL